MNCVNYVYTRRLKGGHVYVGKTHDPAARTLGHELQPPGWILRHGLDESEELLVVGQTTAIAASGLESLWTARLMWALGVNKVRGGDKCMSDDFTKADICHLSQFLHHYLQLSFAEVEKRLCTELKAGIAVDLHVCRLCKEARAYQGSLCPVCYYKECVCGKCGGRGHVEKWCGRILEKPPGGSTTNVFAEAAIAPAAAISAPPASPPMPDFDIFDEHLPIQALDAAQAAFEEEHRKRPAPGAGDSQPNSEVCFPKCMDCQQHVPGGRPRCYPCWLAMTPCFLCMEVGHTQRDCPRSPGKKRKT